MEAMATYLPLILMALFSAAGTGMFMGTDDAETDPDPDTDTTPDTDDGTTDSLTLSDYVIDETDDTVTLNDVTYDRALYPYSVEVTQEDYDAANGDTPARTFVLESGDFDVFGDLESAAATAGSMTDYYNLVGLTDFRAGTDGLEIDLPETAVAAEWVPDESGQGYSLVVTNADETEVELANLLIGQDEIPLSDIVLVRDATVLEVEWTAADDGSASASFPLDTDGENFYGTDGADSLLGTTLDDIIRHNENILAGSEDAIQETTYFDAGADAIDGGAGDDTIYFSATDTVTGGDGTDSFTADVAVGTAADTLAVTDVTTGPAIVTDFDAETEVVTLRLASDAWSDTDQLSLPDYEVITTADATSIWIEGEEVLRLMGVTTVNVGLVGDASANVQIALAAGIW